MVAWLAHRRPKVSLFWLWGFYFLAMASHGFLDTFTGGGPGVASFAPFDDTRYFFPWRPLVVSPIVLDILSDWGFWTLVSSTRRSASSQRSEPRSTG